MKTEAVSVDELSLDSTCRTCLSTGSDQKLSSIFKDIESSKQLPAELLNQLMLLKLEISEDDGYPENICNTCIGRLIDINAFQKQCQKAQAYLKQYFIKNSEDAPDIEPNLLVCIEKDSENSNNCEDFDQPEHEVDANQPFLSEEEPEESSLGDEESGVLEKSSKNDKKPNVFPCDECKMSFKSKRHLTLHGKNVHSGDNYACPVCDKQFTQTSKYEYHLKTHDEKKKFKCRHCDKSFIYRNHMKNHELTHLAKRQRPFFLCNICGKSFLHENTLKKHITNHECKPKTYICHVCDKQFRTKSNLKLHIVIHTKAKNYQCELCGEKFTHRSTLSKHQALHKSAHSIRCELCGESFLRPRDRTRHYVIVHGTTDLSLENDQPEPLPEATNEEESAEIKPVISTKAESKRGRSTTTEIDDSQQQQYDCHLCTRSFRLPLSLAKHIKVHDQERNFNCTECGNTFKSLSHLKSHIEGVHVKRKPYSCEVCKKSFARIGDRNVHMQIHSKEKAQCNFCGKSFTMAKALRSHIRQHTGERPFVCIVCNATYTCFKSLASHTRRLHADDQQILRKVEELAQTVLSAPSSAKVEDDTSTLVTKTEAV